MGGIEVVHDTTYPMVDAPNKKTMDAGSTKVVDNEPPIDSTTKCNIKYRFWFLVDVSQRTLVNVAIKNEGTDTPHANNTAHKFLSGMTNHKQPIPENITW